MKKKTDTRTNAQSRFVSSDSTELKKGAKLFDTSKEKYKTLFNGMMQGAFFQAPDGSLLDVNPKALTIFGLTRKAFLHRNSHSPIWKVIREDGSIMTSQEHPSTVALKTGLPVLDVTVGVFNPRKKNYVWVIVNAVPLFHPGETTPYQVCVTLHDITERLQAAKALRLSEERSRVLTETAPDAIITADKQGRIVSWNQGAQKIYGFKPKEIIGSKSSRIIPRNERQKHNKIFAALIKAGKPLTSENPSDGHGLRKGGEVFEVEVSFNLTWYDNEPFFTIFVRDISKRKQLERILYEREKRLRLLVENAPISICIFDSKGSLLQANKVSEQCFGRPVDELLRHGLNKFLHPDDREQTRQAIIRMVENHGKKGKHVVIENRYFAADGRTVYTKQSIQGLFDAQGKISFALMLTEDITITKQLSLMNTMILNKLKDVHVELDQFARLLSNDKHYLQSKSLSDYSLTSQESKIASMIYHGSSNKGIAHKLCLSENTVKHHVTGLYAKMKVKNRMGLIRTIRENHIII
jgi:PAS domain S-box-containing protein